MARFDVHRLSSGELVVDCQADVLDFLQTRFVVPLLDPNTVPAPVHRLHPVFDVGDSRMLMATHLASAIERRELKRAVASLDHEASAILNALDMLMIGY